MRDEGIQGGLVPVVTVFGSSRVGPGQPEYEAALELGRLLGSRGWTLCNGGYNGTMEAAAKGAKEADGSTIGVTISLFADATPNSWIDQLIVTDSFLGRLEKLVGLGSAYVVLPGGIGTLLELAMVWNLAQVPGPRKPILVVGPSWSTVLEAFRGHLPVHPWEDESLTFVASVQEAVQTLDAHFGG